MTTLAYFRTMALEMIDSVYTILDATVQECDISLCNITPSNDHSIIAEPDTSSCPADLDISNIRQFTRLLYIKDSRNTSQTSVNIPIQHLFTLPTAESKENNKDTQHPDEKILLHQAAHLVKNQSLTAKLLMKGFGNKIFSKILLK